MQLAVTHRCSRPTPRWAQMLSRALGRRGPGLRQTRMTLEARAREWLQAQDILIAAKDSSQEKKR